MGGQDFGHHRWREIDQVEPDRAEASGDDRAHPAAVTLPDTKADQHDHQRQEDAQSADKTDIIHRLSPNHDVARIARAIKPGNSQERMPSAYSHGTTPEPNASR